MKRWLGALALALGACAAPAPRAAVYPPEFGPHESIWLAWPVYENKAGVPTEPLIAELIEAFDGHVLVDLLVQDQAELEAVRAELEEAGVPVDHVRFRVVPHADVWLRDMGPIFAFDEAGERVVLDFSFNVWGYEDEGAEGARAEERVDRDVAELLGLRTIRTDLVSEGGDREVNGAGVLIACEAVERQRNPDWTLEEIEAALLAMLGQEKLIWIPEGLAEDELTFRGTLPGGVFTAITTGGHVDEFVRFAGPRTILLAELSEEEARDDPIAAISRERLLVAERILREATDVDGRPFELVRMPVPDTLFATMRAGDGVFDYIQPLAYEDGTVVAPEDEITVVWASSYLNFIVTNGLVVVPQYAAPGRPEALRAKDAEARRILAEVFPGREIVGVDPAAVNLGGGGIHCISQQMPARP